MKKSRSFTHHLEKKCGLKGNSAPIIEKVYFNNFLFFLNALRKIRRSKKIIYIDMYIFSTDKLGKFFLTELTKAWNRGVQIKVLVDGIGSLEFAQSSYLNFSHPSFMFKVYNPVPWPISKLYLKEIISPSRFLSLILRINRRNHKKLIIIDEDTAFIGSHNINYNSFLWRETSLEVNDPETIYDLIKVFNWTWNRSFAPARKIFFKKKKPLLFSQRLCFSSHFGLRNVLREELLYRIARSQKRIQIVMPYFFPPLKMMRALTRAAKRGTKIEIILPKKSDIVLFPRISRILYKTLLHSGVRIFEYTTNMVHAKQVLIDDWLIIGSSNFNHRSFFLDLEISYALSEAKNISPVTEQFIIDKRNSQEIFTNTIDETKWSIIFYSILAKLFKSWI